MSVRLPATQPPARALSPKSVGASLVLSALLAATSANAASPEAPPSVQWNVGLPVGVCGVGTEDAFWDRTRFCGAVRSDVLFLRERESSLGLGPYASVGTAAFDDARIGGGASLLLPVLEDFPIVLSLGGLAQLGDGPAAPGAEAWLFWGAHSFNFHDSYALRNGLLLGVQTTFEDERRSALWLTAQIDAAWPLLPFVMLAGWLQGDAD
jgi:hypothetical protein